MGENAQAWEVQGADGQPLARSAVLLNAPNGGVTDGAEPDQQAETFVQIPMASGQVFSGAAGPASVVGSAAIEGVGGRVVLEVYGAFAEQFATLRPERRVIAMRTSGIDPAGQLGPVIPLPSGWMACTSSLADTQAGFSAISTVEACSGAVRVEVSLVGSPPSELPEGAGVVGDVVVVPLIGDAGDVEDLAEEIDDALEFDVTE